MYTNLALKIVASSVLGLSAIMSADISGAVDFGATQVLAIEPMSIVGADGSGYLADPNPVRLAAAYAGHNLWFSGTTKAILQCSLPVTPQCFRSTRTTIDAGSLRDQILDAGASITNFQNLDIFQDNEGFWHAALSIGIHTPAHPESWTVLVHAHPGEKSTPELPPRAWSADTVLTGSFSEPVEGNYDGKYFEDEGQLYLLYVKNLTPKPALRNGIVLQPMKSPTQLAPTGPITLLTPGDRYGDLDSEWYAHTQAKLVEAPYLAKIGRKYALIYSTGAYREVDYKAGVAWSDQLIPPRNGRYRKVLRADPLSIWGKSAHPEVQYLLQSQKPTWPHYTAEQAISPGVASVIRSPGAGWLLFFAAFDPSDRPLMSANVAQGDHRRPFFVPLKVDVPAEGSVSQVTDAELATWLEPITRSTR